MSWPGRFFANDEEIGKKNDDHRPQEPSTARPWSVRQQGPAVRKRRLVYLACSILLLYLFVRNIQTDVGPHPKWADTRIYRGPNADMDSVPLSPAPPTKRPPRPSQPSEAEEHYHDGPIKFYKLAVSLHAAAKLGGQREFNKNVLFAAASLKSVSELLPLACEMARWERNDVHMAIMGRDEMEISEIQKLNGALEEDCEVHWHDARPDYSKWSSKFRMEASVTASLEHIQTFIHPQVVIIDDSGREDDYFADSIKIKAREIAKPVIELPPDAVDNLMWMTRLDSASLAAWPTIYIDVLIQAPSGSSGTIVRLLRSIETADYFGARRPHLTVELPAEVDAPTWGYLENLVWPPMEWNGLLHVSQVTLRHRIPRKTTTPEEASSRLLESFYPRRIVDSHVLLLSPQVELSPLYYHYLFYSVLEYKYASYAQGSKEAGNVIGISLDLPTSYLNDTTNFAPPIKHKPKRPALALHDEYPPFLWQSPNDNAALYFGDKWTEFHSFLSARLTKAPSTTEKVISKKHPAWLEYLLELMRARGYSLIYPGIVNKDFSLVTVHDELYQVPEEFSKTKKTPSPDNVDIPLIQPDQALEANSTAKARRPPPNTEHDLLGSPITSLLPDRGDLLEASQMALLSYDGIEMTLDRSSESSFFFSHYLAHSVGGCTETQTPYQRVPLKAIDLFCDLGDPYDFDAATKPKPEEEQYAPKEPARPHDEDMIKDEQVDHAKAEAARHLDRQAGGSGVGPMEEEKGAKGAKGAKDSEKEAGKAKPDSNADPKTKDHAKAKAKPTAAKSKASDESTLVSENVSPKASKDVEPGKGQTKPEDEKETDEGRKKSPGW